MAIAVLNELQQRLHAAAIAGVNLVGEDFRLKKAVEQFEPLAAKAPVFQKIYQKTSELIQTDCPDPAQALMDAVTLVDAVVCTQADTALKGELQPIELIAKDSTSTSNLAQSRYSSLEPLHNVLRRSGFGRYEVLRSAWDNNDPALTDYRLQRDLIKALGDSYSDLADLVVYILSDRDASILPYLLEGFDPKGNKEMVRRLKVMRKLATADLAGFFQGLLEGTSTEVRQEAIRCLGNEASNVPKLIELTKTQRGNTLKVVLYTLGKQSSPDAIAYWQEHFEPEYLTFQSSDAIADLLADRIDEALAKGFITEKGKEDSEAIDHFSKLLSAISNKSSEKLYQVLKKLADPKNIPPTYNKKMLQLNYERYDTSRKKWDIISLLNYFLMCGMIYQDRPEVSEMVKRLYQECGDVYLQAAFLESLIHDAKATYDRFYDSLSNTECVRFISQVFADTFYDEAKKQYFIRAMTLETEEDYWVGYLKPIGEKLDIRWFQFFFSNKAFQLGVRRREDFPEYIIRLVNPDDKDSLKLIQDYLLKRLKAGADNSLYLLRRSGWTDFTGLILPYIMGRQLQYREIVYFYQTFTVPEDVLPKELREIQELVKDGKIKSGRPKQLVEKIDELLKQLSEGKRIEDMRSY